MSDIVGSDRLIAKLHKLASNKLGEDIVKRAVHNGAKLVQAEAKLLAPANNGELRQNIKTKVELTTSGQARGIVYNPLEYASYVEFGTGPKGAADHSGISPDVSVSYRNTPWYVHEDQIDVGPYRFQKIGEFYKIYGQAAQPFLYPALANNKERVTKNISNYVNRKIKEAAQ